MSHADHRTPEDRGQKYCAECNGFAVDRVADDSSDLNGARGRAMTKLHLADGLSLPADLATHVTLIAGKRGSGKTNTAKRVVEQLHRARVPFGVLDPVDVWWGLKAGRDGAAQGGLEGVYVFGGKHAEYPLAPTGGAIMADLFVDYRISAVMEMREWSGADRARFVTAFAHRLLERNTEPFALIAEEAHDLMPQQAMGEEKGSLGAMLRLVKLGRSGGIGLVELTQRLAALNKTATTQADVLVMHRTTGPQDRKALNDWILEHHASDEERDAFLRSLPELKTGEAYVWAPDFPEDKPLGLQRVRILECETFNSHATPKVGEKRSEPKALRPADLERLAKAMAATVEKAKQDDPAELRKRIRELERAVGRSPAEPPQPKTVEKRVEVPVLKDGQLARAEKLVERIERIEANLHNPFDDELAALREVGATISQAIRSANTGGVTSGVSRADARSTPGSSVAPPVRAGSVREPRRPGDATARSSSRRESAGPARTTEGVSRPQQRILDALAWIESAGLPPRKRNVVANLAGVSAKSSGFEKNVSTLSTAGLIRYPGAGALELTDAGRAAANAPGAPLTPDELQAEVFTKISGPQAQLLRVLIPIYPQGISREDLAERAGVSALSSGFEKNVSTLSSFGWVIYPDKGHVAAAADLFLEGRT